jgi:RND family efflux transporter MFP subunit
MRPIHLFIVFTFLLIGACTHEESHLAEDNRPTVKVSLAKPKSLQPEQVIAVSGTIQASREAQLSPRIMGYIEGLKVKEGDRVRRGQLLATIANEELEAKKLQVNAQIEQAEIGLANVEKDYKRIQSLFEKKSTTQKSLDDISAQYKLAQQRVEQARQALKEVEANQAYISLKAPISGLVTEKYLQSGDLATPGRPILKIESPDSYQVQLSQLEL